MRVPIKNNPMRMTRSISAAAAILAATMLTGCVSESEQRRSDLYRDGGTCADYGAPYGTRSHTGCMLRQQERRDQEQLLAMERARISSETARNNLEMLREIRRGRDRH